MAYTLEQLEKLEAAIASGVETVRYGDKTVTYHSLDQMRALRDEMRSSLGVSGGNGTAQSRTTYATFDRS